MILYVSGIMFSVIVIKFKSIYFHIVVHEQVSNLFFKRNHLQNSASFSATSDWIVFNVRTFYRLKFKV